MKIQFGEIYIQILVNPNNKIFNGRMMKKKNLFDKGFTPRWTEEVFRISKTVLTIPITYKIIDLNGEESEWSFYEQELQKSTQDIFRMEKVLKRKGDKSLVKWVVYSDAFNSWIDNKALVGNYNII